MKKPIHLRATVIEGHLKYREHHYYSKLPSGGNSIRGALQIGGTSNRGFTVFQVSSRKIIRNLQNIVQIQQNII